MSLSPNPQAKANQLANLRPVSADPALASRMGKVHGFGSTHGPRCVHVKRNGQPCQNRPAHGTPKCHKHGAYRFEIARGKNPYAHINQARRALAGFQVPLELQRHPEWIASEGLGARQWLRKLELATAWDAMQNGNPELWRKALI